jgi:hypothetical protein
MHLLLATMAFDRDTERRRDIDHRHALDLARMQPRSTGRTRRFLAVVLTRVSLASADAVRALDACVADDLSSRLGAAQGR